MTRRLLDSEWIILRALWDKPPQGMKDIISSVKEEQPDLHWQYKTYHSYLRIMLDKGLIGCETRNEKDKLYYPVITREQALQYESDSLLSRIRRDSVGDLVAMMAQNGQISEQDKRELTQLFASLASQEEVQ